MAGARVAPASSQRARAANLMPAVTQRQITPSPAQIPPQSTPLVDPATGAMDKTWWLALNALFSAGGGGGGATDADGMNLLTVSGGVVTPDLTQGSIQHVVLTADAVLAAPTGTGPVTWTLVVDQDATGNWTLSPGPTYGINFELVSGPLTRTQIRWLLDAAGKDSISGSPSVGQPIP